MDTVDLLGRSRYITSLLVGGLGLFVGFLTLLLLRDSFQFAEAVGPASLLMSSFVVLLLGLDGLYWRAALNSVVQMNNERLQQLEQTIQALSWQVREGDNNLKTQLQSVEGLLSETNFGCLEGLQKLQARLDQRLERGAQ